MRPCRPTSALHHSDALSYDNENEIYVTGLNKNHTSIFDRFVIGRVHGWFPFFFPLRRGLLAIADGSMATLEDHAMLLLVESEQSAV